MNTVLDYYSSFRGTDKSWITGSIALLVKGGSHAYGTNIASSDLDVRGFALPPRDYIFGFTKVFEQAETKTPADTVIYELRKFMKLAADNNPNICEILWTDESDYLDIRPAGLEIIAEKQSFLSKKARHTFAGYANSQLQRINLHHKYLKNPPKSPPERATFGLPDRTVIPKDQLMAAEAAITKQIDSWELDLSNVEDAVKIHIMTQLHSTLDGLTAFATFSSQHDLKSRAASELLGYDSNFIDLLDRERKYKTAHKEWTQYQDWKANRNPQRAELEEKFGFDCKHAMHLVRLLRMCEEILTTGKVTVKRPDAEDLLRIRHGDWTYDQLIEWSAKQDAKIGELYKTSTLPRDVDRDHLNKLCIRVLDKYAR